jgi:uncharacterized protein (DUF433 family)
MFSPSQPAAANVNAFNISAMGCATEERRSATQGRPCARRTLKGIHLKARSVPDVAFVEGDLVALEQGAKLVLKRNLTVTLLLIGDVGYHGALLRRANRENAVARSREEVKERLLGRGGRSGVLDEGNELEPTALRPYVRTMKYLDRITFDPEQCGGRPCIRGMRIRVKDVLEMLAGGASEKQILEDFPDLEAEDIRASLAFAAAQANHAVLQTAA